MLIQPNELKEYSFKTAWGTCLKSQIWETKTGWSLVKEEPELWHLLPTQVPFLPQWLEGASSSESPKRHGVQQEAHSTSLHSHLIYLTLELSSVSSCPVLQLKPWGWDGGQGEVGNRSKTWVIYTLAIVKSITRLISTQFPPSKTKRLHCLVLFSSSSVSAAHFIFKGSYQENNLLEIFLFLLLN